MSSIKRLRNPARLAAAFDSWISSPSSAHRIVITSSSLGSVMVWACFLVLFSVPFLGNFGCDHTSTESSRMNTSMRRSAADDHRAAAYELINTEASDGLALQFGDGTAAMQMLSSALASHLKPMLTPGTDAHAILSRLWHALILSQNSCVPKLVMPLPRRHQSWDATCCTWPSHLARLNAQANAAIRDDRLAVGINGHSVAICAASCTRRCAARASDEQEAAAVCCANRSLAQARAGHLLRALRDAQRAVALAPAYAPAHRRVGAVLRQLGRHREARRAMATATLLAGRSCTPTRLAREHWCETTPSFPARAGAISSTADRGDEEASALDLDWLGAALARGKERHEMSLAVRCASFLGPPPWKLPHAVSIHRRLGAPSPS